MKMAREGTLPKRVRRREPTYSSSDALSRISIERQKSFNHRRPGWVCRIPALREHNIFVNPTGRRGEACCRFLVVLAVGTTASPVIQHAAFAQAGPAWLEQAKADYQKALAENDAARQQYEAQAAPYWTFVSDKRQLRNTKRRNGDPLVVDDYVLAQPPIYAGPPRPVDPTAPTAKAPVTRTAIPGVADFLSNALTQLQFVPERPHSELEFKAAYVGVAAEAGLTRSQIVRVCAFESGGNGTYDVQAGLEYDRPDALPIFNCARLQSIAQYPQRRTHGRERRPVSNRAHQEVGVPPR